MSDSIRVSSLLPWIHTAKEEVTTMKNKEVKVQIPPEWSTEAPQTSALGGRKDLKIQNIEIRKRIEEPKWVKKLTVKTEALKIQDEPEVN